jgi:hypothetical protein
MDDPDIKETEARVAEEERKRYWRLDKLIVKLITLNPGIQSQEIFENADIIAEASRLAGTHPAWRIVDARLRSLRWSWVIKCASDVGDGGWCMYNNCKG